MSKKYKKWEKLDNTAKVFPVIATDEMTNTYRISVVLNERVDGEVLQQALNMVLPKMPGFNMRLRTGFFWYYLEENGKPAPKVFEEKDYPCRRIYAQKNNSYLFRVTYYKTRINLEVFHVLADGMGGIGFLRELTYQYLRLKHSELSDVTSDRLSDETSLNREDSYISNYNKASKSVYASKKAFLIKGDKLPYNGFGVIQGLLPVSRLKDVSRNKYGVSINEYLISAFVYATYRTYRRMISEEKPIRVAIPVNMRPFFDSNTTKNFFVMISAEFAPRNKEYTFEEIVAVIHESIQLQMKKEHLEAIFSYNVSNEQHIAARSVPLFLKNIGIKVVYTRAALANTTTITNIGNITVKEEYEPYIKMFHSFLSFSKGQELKGTITSYKDTLAYTFTSSFEDTTVQRRVFQQIAQDGVEVQIETNGVYYE